MALSFSGKTNVTGTNDFLDLIKDTAVAAGWTLHDDQSGGSPYAYILSSTGEDADQMTCYLRIYNGTNKVVFLMYGYWNNSTHAGTYYMGNATYSRVVTTDSTSFDAFVTANKSSIIACAYSASKWNQVSVGILDPWVDDALGELDTAASSGSSVDLSLGAGEAADFKIGDSYQIVDGTSRQWVEVEDVDDVTDTITITTLSYSFAIGAKIGTWPYRWFIHNSQNYNYIYLMSQDVNGTGNNTSQETTVYNFFNVGYLDPMERAGGDYYMLFPYAIYDATSYAGFFCEDHLYFRIDINIATNEHTVSINEHDTGTSSGSNTTTTLNDTTKSWTTNEYQNKALIISAGTGAGQVNTISSNTSTQLTVSDSWTTTPDATSEYVICDEAWLYLHFNNGTYANGVIRAA